MRHHARRAASTYALWLLTALGATTAATGCRVTDDDIRRWEQTEHGPEKLVAVITHDKYSWELRRDAALALIRMKPRAGQRVGLRCEAGSDEVRSVCLQEAVASLSPDERRKLMSQMIPVLIEELNKPPTPQPGAAAGDTRAVIDTSVPFKDAAFALLSYDKVALVPDDDQRKTLQAALVNWSTTDFDRRVAITNQVYAPEQIFRRFGPEGVKGLPARITPDGAYDRASALISELGDPATKDTASKKLVELAQYTESQAWFDKNRPAVEAANKLSGYNATGDKLDKQVRAFQEEQIVKVFASMKKLGGRPVIDYLLTTALDKSKPDSRRQASVAALEAKLDRNNPGDVQKIASLASADDTPDSVRDLAFQRVSELPREAVAPTLYQIMSTAKRWRIRWVAASTLLKMSGAKDAGEFFAKLPTGPATGFAMSEPLTYGDLLGRMKPPAGKDAVTGFLRSTHIAQKLTALGWFYANGRASDLPSVQPLEDDRGPLPKVDDAEGKYQCGVPKAGGKPGETETKEVTTVGEFVKVCVEPPMRDRK